MTPDRLAKIRARCEASVPGPWDVEVSHWAKHIVYLVEHEGRAVMVTAPKHVATAYFITNARKDVADLLDEVARLSKQINQMMDNLKR